MDDALSDYYKLNIQLIVKRSNNNSGASQNMESSAVSLNEETT